MFLNYLNSHADDDQKKYWNAQARQEQVGAMTSGECQCMKGFYDNRQNISDSSDAPKVFVIEHGDAIQKESTARCIPCHEGMVCDSPGVTLRNG